MPVVFVRVDALMLGLGPGAGPGPEAGFEPELESEPAAGARLEETTARLL